MSGRVVGRIAMALLALVAVGSYVVQVRSVRLRENAEAAIRRAGPGAGASATAGARRDLRRAARLTFDPTADLDEAATLLQAGQGAAAARILEPVVQANRGSIRGWQLLAAATAATDPRRSIEANAHLLEFRGRLQGLPLAPGSAPGPGGTRAEVRAGAVQGSVQRFERPGGIVLVTGWAANLTRRRPAASVLVLSHGRLVRIDTPSGLRNDVASRYGPALRHSGFQFRLPRSLVDRSGRLDVHVVGIDNGGATLLPFACGSAPGPSAC